MHHSDIAQIAAVLGALGAPAVLAARARVHFLLGLGLLILAEAGFAYGLVPGHDVHAAVASPARIAAVLVLAVILAALVAAVVRWPVLTAPFLLAAAPFRIPVNVGGHVAAGQQKLLLLPLYAVLVVVGVAFTVRVLRGTRVIALPPLLVVPASAFIALDAISLLWSEDKNHGSVELAFFILPFAALVAVVARSPIGGWVPKALTAVLLAEASLFAAVGLWQVHSHHLFFSHHLKVANSYTTFFRVNSLFYDPNIYGRFLMLALGILVVLLWRDRLPVGVVAGFFVLLGAGLYVSYSLSSEITLFVVTLAVTLFTVTGVRVRQLVAIVAGVAVLLVAGAVALKAEGHSFRKITSDRSHTVSITWKVVRHHPLIGVGVGAQPAASNKEIPTGSKKLDASHTTPLTVAAELGILGVIAYIALLIAAARLFLAAARFDGVLAAALAVVFGAIAAHSLAYADFFEDPLTWGALALAAAVVARGGPAEAISSSSSS